jgi:hypothetical protein
MAGHGAGFLPRRHSDPASRAGRAPVRAVKLKESVLVVERGRHVGGCRCAEICELATTPPPSSLAVLPRREGAEIAAEVSPRCRRLYRAFAQLDVQNSEYSESTVSCLYTSYPDSGGFK